MARKQDSKLLDAGDSFPALSFTLTDGTTFAAPADFARPFAVVLVNRGSWCPFCVGQLKSFQASLGKLTELGVDVLSVSAEAPDAARAMVTQHGLTFPVAASADLEQVATALGTFFDPAPKHTTPYLQSSGFILGPDRKVLTSVYSSGAIGRLVAADVLGLVQYVKSLA